MRQAKCNKEINIARLCKTNPKGFYSYINERRIVKDNVGPLKTPTGQIITPDNDMANTLNTYFCSVFTHKQLNNIPQLPRYVGNTLDTFNFRLEDVQEKLNHLNMYKSTGPDLSTEIPEELYIGHSESGCMKSANFYEYIGNPFITWLNEHIIPKPVILFIDGHPSHFTFQV